MLLQRLIPKERMPECPTGFLKPRLQDTQGRVIRKLRVSLLDACNFRCSYCMPQDVRFAPKLDYLKPAELYEIVGQLVGFGISHLRLTGGEPTLRTDFSEIVHALGGLPLQKKGLTTNGFLLKSFLPVLEASGFRSINISLDSLQAERFNRLTRTQAFDQVYQNILRTRDAGFEVKINTVVIKGFNDDELIDFVHFAEREQIEVRFLELMRIGEAISIQDQRFISADEMMQQIRTFTTLQPQENDFDATAFRLMTAAGGRLGFIASESRPFCGSCSRLRLSYDGQLRACLMLSEGRSLRHQDLKTRQSVLREVMGMKPITRMKEVQQAMHEIGG